MAQYIQGIFAAFPHFRITALTQADSLLIKKYAVHVNGLRAAWLPFMMLLFIFAIPAKTYALPAWLNDIEQAKPDGIRFPMINQVFDRQTYTLAVGSVGFNAWAWDPVAEKLVYTLKKGDNAGIVLFDADTNSILSAGIIHVVSEDGLCWSDGVWEFCGYFGAMNFGFNMKCMPEDQRIRVSGYFNGQLVGSAFFTPTPFHPKVNVIFMPDTLEPRRSRILQGQYGDIAVQVTDDIDCGISIPGVKVRFASTIAKNNTIGQIYLTQNER